MSTVRELKTLLIVDKSGIAGTVGPRTIEELLKVGVIRRCPTDAFTWHTDLTHDAIDSIADELGTTECGFCHTGTPTHQVAVDHTKLNLMGSCVSARPLSLCGDCALLFQTGDRELLVARCLEASVELNRDINRVVIAVDGEETLRKALTPVAKRVAEETFGAVVGQPYPIPPREGGFIVIGET